MSIINLISIYVYTCARCDGLKSLSVGPFRCQYYGEGKATGQRPFWILFFSSRLNITALLKVMQVIKEKMQIWLRSQIKESFSSQDINAFMTGWIDGD